MIEMNIHSLLQIQDNSGEWQNIHVGVLDNDKPNFVLFQALQLGLGIPLPSTPEPRGLPHDLDRIMAEDGVYIDMKTFIFNASNVFNTWWLGNELFSYLSLDELYKLAWEAHQQEATLIENYLARIYNFAQFIISHLILVNSKFSRASTEKTRIIFGFDEIIVDQEKLIEPIPRQRSDSSDDPDLSDVDEHLVPGEKLNSLFLKEEAPNKEPIKLYVKASKTFNPTVEISIGEGLFHRRLLSEIWRECYPDFKIPPDQECLLHWFSENAHKSPAREIIYQEVNNLKKVTLGLR